MTKKTTRPFSPPKKLRLIQAQKGHCTKYGLPFTQFNPLSGSYAYKTANGAWVTGQQCKKCASQTGKTGRMHEYTINEERRLVNLMRLQEQKEEATKKPKKKRKHRPAKGKKRGPYGTSNNQSVKEFLKELKKPTPQRYGAEKTWKTHWQTDPELRLLFANSYRGMRSFASSYGYDVGDVREMKRHKEKMGEGRRR